MCNLLMVLLFDKWLFLLHLFLGDTLREILQLGVIVMVLLKFQLMRLHRGDREAKYLYFGYMSG